MFEDPHHEVNIETDIFLQRLVNILYLYVWLFSVKLLFSYIVLSTENIQSYGGVVLPLLEIHLLLDSLSFDISNINFKILINTNKLKVRSSYGFVFN